MSIDLIMRWRASSHSTGAPEGGVMGAAQPMGLSWKGFRWAPCLEKQCLRQRRRRTK